MAIAIIVLAALLAATAINARPDAFDASANIQNGGEQQWQAEWPHGAANALRAKDEEDVGQEMEPPHAPAAPGDNTDSVIISPPPPGASVAEARPVATAVAGPGGVAAAKPVATAIVGPAGLAVARPVAIAIAGVPLSPASLSTLPGLGGPVAASHLVPAYAAPLHYGPSYHVNGYPLPGGGVPVGPPFYVYGLHEGVERLAVGPTYDVNSQPLGYERVVVGPSYGANGHPQVYQRMPVGPAMSHVRVLQPGNVEYSQVVLHSS